MTRWPPARPRRPTTPPPPLLFFCIRCRRSQQRHEWRVLYKSGYPNVYWSAIDFLPPSFSCLLALGSYCVPYPNLPQTLAVYPGGIAWDCMKRRSLSRLLPACTGQKRKLLFLQPTTLLGIRWQRRHGLAAASTSMPSYDKKMRKMKEKKKRSYLGASDAPRSVLYIQSLLAGSKVLDTDKNADENRADSSCWLLFSLDKHHMSLACVCARAPSLPLFIEIADSSLLPCVCRWGNSARNWKQQHQTRPAPWITLSLSLSDISLIADWTASPSPDDGSSLFLWRPAAI